MELNISIQKRVLNGIIMKAGISFQLNSHVFQQITEGEMNKMHFLLKTT